LNKAGELWKNVRRWLPGVLISLVAFYAVFRVASWQDLTAAFAAVKLPNLATAFALTILSLLTRSIAWRILLQDKPSLKQSFLIINEGYLLNNLFPLRAGEIGRAVFMGQASGLGGFHVLSTIVIERLFDLFMAAIMLLSTLPLAITMDWVKPIAVITLVVVLAALVAMFFVARYHEKVAAWLSGIGKRWAFFGRVVMPRLDSLFDGLTTLTQPRRFLMALFWIALSWVVWVLMYYFMLLSIAPQAPLWWAIFTDGVLAMGVAIPSAPGALGVYEASIVGALSIFGINASAALAFALIMHLLQYATTGVFGVIGLISQRHSLSAVLQSSNTKSETQTEQKSSLDEKPI